MEFSGLDILQAQGTHFMKNRSWCAHSSKIYFLLTLEHHMLMFYGTAHCHLCETAATMLSALKISCIEVDIVNDDALLQRYGILIPVLRDELGRELHWPFTEQDITEFLMPG